jgi:hypothetical protein
MRERASASARTRDSSGDFADEALSPRLAGLNPSAVLIVLAASSNDSLAALAETNVKLSASNSNGLPSVASKLTGRGTTAGGRTLTESFTGSSAKAADAKQHKTTSDAAQQSEIRFDMVRFLS